MAERRPIRIPEDVYLLRLNDDVQRKADLIVEALKQEGWLTESKYDRDWKPQRLVAHLLRSR